MGGGGGGGWGCLGSVLLSADGGRESREPFRHRQVVQTREEVEDADRLPPTPLLSVHALASGARSAAATLQRAWLAGAAINQVSFCSIISFVRSFHDLGIILFDHFMIWGVQPRKPPWRVAARSPTYPAPAPSPRPSPPPSRHALLRQ